MLSCGRYAPQLPESAQQPAVLAPCRPLAFSHGATDELTHSLGQTWVHLGMNMAATAVPLDPEDPRGPEDAVLYFGIIDILQVGDSPLCCRRSADPPAAGTCCQIPGGAQALWVQQQHHALLASLSGWQELCRDTCKLQSCMDSRYLNALEGDASRSQWSVVISTVPGSLQAHLLLLASIGTEEPQVPLAIYYWGGERKMPTAVACPSALPHDSC